MKQTQAILSFVLGTVTFLNAQGTTRFEVASIKRDISGDPMFASIGPAPGGRWAMVNHPIRSLILSAYPTSTHEVVGTPAWVLEEGYDIEAKADGVPSAAQRQSMLQELLADRFAFRGHYEKVERPVYDLVVARNDGRLGPQIRRFDGDCARYADAVHHGQTLELPVPTNGARACGFLFGQNRILSGGVAIGMLAANVSQAASRVVIDKTNLPGVYEFTLRYSQTPGPSAVADETPSIFSALQEQLGLKLEARKGVVDIVVVDHIEQPVLN